MLFSHVSSEKIFQENNHSAPHDVLTVKHDVDQHFNYRGSKLALYKYASNLRIHACKQPYFVSKPKVQL